MSDRYRPRGPKSLNHRDHAKSRDYSRDYNRDYPSSSRSSSSYVPKNESKDSYIPSGPKRDNYRPNGFRKESKPSPASNFTPGVKRPLPSGPSSFKKRRDFHNIPKGPKSKAVAVTNLLPHQIYTINRKGSHIYERVQQVGEGTYGKVYKVKHTMTNEFVAFKKLRLESEKEGFPITAIREIKLLQSFDHPNVIGLLEMMIEQKSIYMVFDYLDHDLTGLLSHPDLSLQECHKKHIFKQLIEGLNYLHRKRIIHRDIKGSNILLDRTGNLKIADFGLARPMKILKKDELPDYTNRVITIWYRPPELLLGATDYGREVDVWGVGCLLMELYYKIAVFRGMDEISQLCKIFNIMGTPTMENWPDVDKLPWFEMLKPRLNLASKFESKFKKSMSEEAFTLAQKLLHLNPKRRPTSEEILQDNYFKNDPQPEPLYFLKDFEGEWHEFETKQRRREERKRIKDEEDAEAKTQKASPDIVNSNN